MICPPGAFSPPCGCQNGQKAKRKVKADKQTKLSLPYGFCNAELCLKCSGIIREVSQHFLRLENEFFLHNLQTEVPLVLNLPLDHRLTTVLLNEKMQKKNELNLV